MNRHMVGKVTLYLVICIAGLIYIIWVPSPSPLLRKPELTFMSVDRANCQGPLLYLQVPLPPPEHKGQCSITSDGRLVIAVPKERK